MSFQNLSIKLKKNIFNYGLASFSLGILFLGSAPSISTFFLIVAMLASSQRKNILQVNDKYSLIFLIVSIIMIFNAFVIHRYFIPSEFEGWDPNLSIIGLINWIPFFICFNGFQLYLKTSKARVFFSKLILVGTIPVLVTAFGQYFLGWDEKITLLNGLIVWYIKPIGTLSGVSGLFSNPNYASAWLSIVWPFVLFYSIKKNNNTKRVLIFIFLAINLFTILSTNSRTGWISLLVPLPLVIGISISKLIIIIIILTILIFFASYTNLLPLVIKDSFLKLLPEKIYNITSFSFNNINNFPRLDIWRVSIKAIFNNPFFGYGAATFPFIYGFLKNNNVNDIHQHTHNLFLELSINYGLLVSIIIFINIISLIKNSWNAIKQEKSLNKNNINKTWLASSLILLITQTFDVTYYDIRISLLFWILISGLKCIIDESE